MQTNAQELLYDSTGQLKTDLYMDHVLDLAENFHSTLLNLAIEVRKQQSVIMALTIYIIVLI